MCVHVCVCICTGSNVIFGWRIKATILHLRVTWRSNVHTHIPTMCECMCLRMRIVWYECVSMNLVFVCWTCVFITLNAPTIHKNSSPQQKRPNNKKTTEAKKKQQQQQQQQHTVKSQRKHQRIANETITGVNWVLIGPILLARNDIPNRIGKISQIQFYP